MIGSSPLTRGKHGLLVHAGHVRGLIPAHAGKTSRLSRTCTKTRAHPRSRGENIQTTVQTVAGWGSSPLTRGKRPPQAPRSCRCGLIPAHAGKTAGVESRSRSRRAHPRSRGENAAIAAMTRKIGGSSPLTRGKPGKTDHRKLEPGLIPAHAGKTGGVYKSRRYRRAHPRSRGENVAVWTDAERAEGSSPLTRGKPVTSRPSSVSRGLIPAHAGKTSSPSARVGGVTAHPRSRGENTLVILASL